MVKNEIKMRSQEGEIFDKKQIALAIRNSTINDELGCSLLDEGILNKCDECGLRDICGEIDQMVDNHVDKTTKIVDNFTF